MREKYTCCNRETTITYKESKLYSVERAQSLSNSYRVYRDGFVGVHMQIGNIDDEEGYRLAEENLERKRPYPFELEKGERSRSKIEKVYTDTELMDFSKECMAYLLEKYPRFIYTLYFGQNHYEEEWFGDQGLHYKAEDCAVNVGVSYKHVDSTDINDGYFNFNLRTYDMNVFKKMADDYLSQHENMVDFPEELIADMQYYSLTGKLISELNAENIVLGNSLLSEKIGKKAFADDFTFAHDVTDDDCWFNTFWDGEGCVVEGDRRVYVDHGVVLSGYADKRTAKKYGVEHTGSASGQFADIPQNGYISAKIDKSEKTIKELLNGRYSIIPVSTGASDWNEKGDYICTVQSALLYDGDKVVGRLPQFTLIANLFDIFGKDFIGVGSDKPIFNDKQILFRFRREKL